MKLRRLKLPQYLLVDIDLILEDWEDSVTLERTNDRLLVDAWDFWSTLKCTGDAFELK